MQSKKKKLFLFQLQICGSSSACRKKNTLQENDSGAAILRYLSMTKFPWKLKYMAKYILKAFFLTTFPLTQKKYPKIYAVTLVLPLKYHRTSHSLFESLFFYIKVSKMLPQNCVFLNHPSIHISKKIPRNRICGIMPRFYRVISVD